MSKIYVITSGKGGVGKTTSAINIAASLNLFKEDVIIVDTNLTTPNVGLHLGAPIVPITLNHVLDNKAELADAIYEHHSGFKIVPASLSVSEIKKINHKNLGNITRELKKLTEHIILDSSAGLGEETKSSISAADEVIIITNPEMPAVTDALKAIKLSEQLHKPVKGFVLTKHKNNKTEMSLPNICEMLEIPHLGNVPDDKNMQKALYLKDAIVHTHPTSKASEAYKEIAAKLLGEEYFNNYQEKQKSFWKRIFG